MKMQIKKFLYGGAVFWMVNPLSSVNAQAIFHMSDNNQSKSECSDRGGSFVCESGTCSCYLNAPPPHVLKSAKTISDVSTRPFEEK